MKITKTRETNGRDFYFMAKCEFCQKDDGPFAGYHDSFFYKEVIPNSVCQFCNRTTNGLAGKTCKLAHTAVAVD